MVLRLMIAKVLNGAGVGATGPLIAYWFAEGPAEIGSLMAGGFLMVAVASVAAGWLSKWLGMVRAVIAMRLVGLVLLIALPLSPSFGLAATLYILRAMFNRGTTGARSALSISIVRPHRRGFAASMANVSMQIPRSVSPVLTGILFAANNLVLPFFNRRGVPGLTVWRCITRASGRSMMPCRSATAPIRRCRSRALWKANRCRDAVLAASGALFGTNGPRVEVDGSPVELGDDRRSVPAPPNRAG
jgi:MFS family permease